MNTRKIHRTMPPAAGPFPRIDSGTSETVVLSNGLRVFLVHEHRPAVTLRFMSYGGEIIDGSRPGAADAHAYLMTRGTLDRPSGDFAEAVEYLGAGIEVDAGADSIAMEVNALRRHVDSVLSLAFEALQRPAFDQHELEQYVGEQIAGLDVMRARPDWLAGQAVRRIAFGSSAYGTLVDAASLRALTTEYIRGRHDRVVVPLNTTLAVVGEFTLNELVEVLERHLAGWRGGGALERVGSALSEAGGPRIIAINRPGSVQSTIRVVGRGPMFSDPDRTPAAIANSILGGGIGLGNRLSMNLRETHGWTYSPRSYFRSFLFGGYFVAEADVSNDATIPAIREIQREIGRMCDEAVETDELERNVRSAVGAFLISSANPRRRAERIQTIDFFGLPQDYYDHLVREYEQTTADDVMRVSRRFLGSETIRIAVVGDLNAIGDDLASLGQIDEWSAELLSVT